MNWIRTEDGYVNLATAQAIIDTGVIDSDGYIRTRYRIIDAGGTSHKFSAIAGRLAAALEIDPGLYAFDPKVTEDGTAEHGRGEH